MFNGRFYRLFVKIYEALLKIADNILATTYNDSWINITSSVTYSSVDDPTGVITIEEDLTGVLSVGMRIKFTNGGNTIYGIITKDPTYSSPNTTITFLHEINPTDSQALHLLANSAITDVYYSHQKAPFGFPLEKNKWTVYISSSGQIDQLNPTQNTWYNINSDSLSIPIGTYLVYYSTHAGIETSADYIYDMEVTLSTGSSSESDGDLSAGFGSDISGNTALKRMRSTVSRQKEKTFASKTTVYLNYRTIRSSIDKISKIGEVPTVIRATSSYL
jgi:hypothetical protein